MYIIPPFKFYGNPSEGYAPLQADRRTDMTKLMDDFQTM